MDGALHEMAAARVPAGPVLSPPQTLAHPQVQASGLVERVDYPGTPGPAPVVGAPIQLSGTPREPMARAPLAGEQGAAILAEAGFTEAEIAEMATTGDVHLGG